MSKTHKVISYQNRIVHYIPPIDWKPLEQEFVEPCSNDYFIWWLFGYRCMECRRSGEEINEIRPRSRSKSNLLDWKNRVLLCRTCHSAYHENGVSSTKAKDMSDRRREYLISIGKGVYA